MKVNSVPQEHIQEFPSMFVISDSYEDSLVQDIPFLVEFILTKLAQGLDYYWQDLYKWIFEI